MGNRGGRGGGERGLALVLVLTVLLALALVATPFVLSMLLHEQSGTASRYFSQADYGAEGARSYALWRLMYSLDPVERRQGSGPFASYHFDAAEEFDIRLTDAYLRRLGIADPRGAIWGLAVQDEQGKLNVRSAPERALTTLAQAVTGRSISSPLQFETSSLAAPKDYLTQYSGRDAAWICPQRIREAGGPGSSGAFTVDNLLVLGPRARVRAVKPGLRPFEGVIASNAILGNAPAPAGFTTDPALPPGYADGVIEVEMRHPVNLNTARRETLVAIFEGLELHNMPQSRVDRGSAVLLADAFANQRIERLDQFLVRLSALGGLRPEQRLAVAINAVCPTAALLSGSGTVPFCFRSYDVYTLEAFAAVNTPVGTGAGWRGFREVASVSAPSMLTRTVESEYDFDQMLNAGADLASYFPRARVAGGYPFGSRMVTFPRIPGLPGGAGEPGQIYGPSDLTLKAQQRPGPGGNEAYVTLVTARDERGRSEWEQALQGWPNRHARDHFEGALEGRRLQGTALTYPWGQVFVTHPPAGAGGGGGGPVPGMLPDVAAGGFELWVRFDGPPPNPVTIFDLREQDFTNRMTLRVENNEIIFTVCDSTIGAADHPIDDGAAEVRQPFSPERDTWYHLAAYWEGTRYAELALLVDGFAHPQQKFSHVNPEGRTVLTRLTGAMTDTSTSIGLQDDSFLPQNVTAFVGSVGDSPTVTPLLVGDEVMIYDRPAGTLVRGARGTQPQAHPAGAAVQVFGYSSRLRRGTVRVDENPPRYPTCTYDRLTTGGGAVRYGFGANPDATVAGDKQDAMTGAWYVDASQSDIGVNTTDIMAFPDQGYIFIENEVIFYTGRDASSPGGDPSANARFTGCVRAQHGTTAARHDSGRPVRIYAVPVTVLDGYLSPTIIQVGDEWFGPVQRDPAGRPFWTSFVVNDNGTATPLPLRRGPAVFGTPLQDHSPGDPVLPTFLVSDTSLSPTRHNLGRYDRVTLVDSSNYREIHRVRNAGPPVSWTNTTGTWTQVVWTGMTVQVSGGAAQIAALENPVGREFAADELHTRVLKFPSGELLGLQWLQGANPSFSVGPLGEATVDEVKAFATPKRALRLSAEAAADAAQLTLNGPPAAERGGLLKIGDEYVGYMRAQAGTVTPLRRGWLSSTAQVHDAGDSVMDLYFIPVYALAGELGATDRRIPLHPRRGGGNLRDLPPRGYVLLDQEIAGYEWVQGQELAMPPRWDGVTGLYRGMFGTAPASHSASSSLAYAIPFRYFDGYKPREFDNTMPYFQWSTRMDLARWLSLWWDQEVPLNDPNIVVHALVRIDGRGEFWDAPGLSDRTLLLDFTTPRAKNPINRVGFLEQAGQFDVRFHVEYRPGSFDATQPWNAHSWKRAPKIKEIRVDYDRPTQTLHREDR